MKNVNSLIIKIKDTDTDDGMVLKEEVSQLDEFQNIINRTLSNYERDYKETETNVYEYYSDKELERKTHFEDHPIKRVSHNLVTVYGNNEDDKEVEHINQIQRPDGGVLKRDSHYISSEEDSDLVIKEIFSPTKKEGSELLIKKSNVLRTLSGNFIYSQDVYLTGSKTLVLPKRDKDDSDYNELYDDETRPVSRYDYCCRQKSDYIIRHGLKTKDKELELAFTKIYNKDGFMMFDIDHMNNRIDYRNDHMFFPTHSFDNYHLTIYQPCKSFRYTVRDTTKLNAYFVDEKTQDIEMFDIVKTDEEGRIIRISQKQEDCYSKSKSYYKGESKIPYKITFQTKFHEPMSCSIVSKDGSVRDFIFTNVDEVREILPPISDGIKDFDERYVFVDSPFHCMNITQTYTYNGNIVHSRNIKSVCEIFEETRRKK